MTRTARLEAKRLKAVRFLESVVGDYDKASEFTNMTAEDYAAHRELEILGNPATNPRIGRPKEMADSKASLQAEVDELQGILEQVEDLCDEGLDPELTREEVVAKLKEIADLVATEDAGEDGEAEDQD